MESHAELLERWKAKVVKRVGTLDEWLEEDLAWLDQMASVDAGLSPLAEKVKELQKVTAAVLQHYKR